MEDSSPAANTKTLLSSNKLFLGILIMSVVLGTMAGFAISKSSPKVVKENADPSKSTTETPKTAQQDNRTFRDFAEGVIQKRSAPKKTGEYAEGTHLLVRQNAVPVAITSSVVDLSEYEGKKVKVFGETQKAIKEGWLMDVGKVEVQQ